MTGKTETRHASLQVLIPSRGFAVGVLENSETRHQDMLHGRYFFCLFFGGGIIGQTETRHAFTPDVFFSSDSVVGLEKEDAFIVTGERYYVRLAIEEPRRFGGYAMSGC